MTTNMQDAFNTPKSSKMELIAFRDEDMVENQQIDEQHLKMAKIVNELYSIMGSDKYNLERHLLRELLDDLRVHFSTEEKYMKEMKFTYFFSHKGEHDRFYKKIAEFVHNYNEGKAHVNLEFLVSIKNWFFNHIDLNDRKLGKFLHEKGIV